MPILRATLNGNVSICFGVTGGCDEDVVAYFHEVHVDQDLEVFRADRHYFRALAGYVLQRPAETTASLSSRLARPVFVMFGSNPE